MCVLPVFARVSPVWGAFCDYRKGAERIEAFIRSFELDTYCTDFLRNAQSYSVERSIIIIFESI